MPGRNLIPLIALVLLTFCGPGYSQHREYIYDHFNISNGLISDNVFEIFIDQEGFAWVVTYNGLQKYNGYEFETYISRPGIPGTLSSNYVMDMFEDREGDIIVVLEDGIDIYHKQTDRFSNILSNLPFASLRRDEISRLASVVQDRSGSIWVTCNNHLVKIDSTKKDFLVYQDEFKGNFVLNGDSTVMWIITDNSIKRYNLVERVLTIRNISEIPGPRPVKRLNTIYYDSDDNCWLGTTDGLFLLDEENYRLLNPRLKHTPYRSAEEVVSGMEITAIYEDYRKDLWIASGEDLYRIDRETGSFQKLSHEVDNPNSILDEQITGIYGNQDGSIWVTYLNEGFTRINIKTKNFYAYRQKVNSRNSLGGKAVRSVFRDPAGYLWAGLYNNGLDRIDPSSGMISHFKHDPAREQSVCSNYISSLFLGADQRLWVGSHDNGVCYADEAYSDHLTFQRPHFLNGSDEVYHILADSLGRVWFGTRTGLGMYDDRTGDFHWILEDHNVQSFLFEGHRIWIASWNYGLCRLDFDRETFIEEIPAFDSTTSIYYSETKYADGTFRRKSESQLRNCISICQDTHGNVWMGTYNMGLARVRLHGKEIFYDIYDASRGAPGNAVYGLTGDKQGKIWISTENGIGKFDPETEYFENYYREDGLLSNYFLWKSYYQSPDGKLYFGSVDGLNFFDPGEIRKDTTTPRVFISELRIQNQLVRNGDTVHGDVILDRQILYQDTLVLNHMNRNFSLKFSSMGHVTPDRIQYAHMLEGFDDHWILNPRGIWNAGYNNLSPGTYHFRVKAIENASLWPEHYLEKTVIILPPWWKTKIAIATYFFLILGFLFLIFYWIFRFSGLRQELIYNEKLHQSKLMFFTNVSHEFKTPLSLIRAPLNEILDDRRLPPHHRKNLHMVRKNADQLLDLVNELMEFRRTDAGISRLRPEQFDLGGYVNEIASQFEYLAVERGIDFLINMPEEKHRIWADREKFRKIINNLLENAFNYTKKGGLVTLSIVNNPVHFKFNPAYHAFQLNQTGKDTDYVGILVSDTGVGISRDSLPMIFNRFFQFEAERAGDHIGSGIGLALVKNLVLMHNGVIKVASERGMGTEILILLPAGDRHLRPEDKLLPEHQPVFKAPVPEQSILSGLPQEGELNVSDAKQRILPRILIVEDHEVLRHYLKDNLSDDFDIAEADNGLEALKKLDGYQPDLIIADWVMPVMDGAGFLREVRARQDTSSIPVMLLTARDDLEDHREGFELGADQIITKPFDLRLLKLQVRRMIENNRSRMRSYGLNASELLVEVRGERASHFIGEVEHVIREHLKDPSLNAELIARKLGLSRTVFFARIKEITGSTPGEYIQKVRLKHAVKLMLYENLSVSEVHVMVGISSSSYLIRLFKKYYHTTPREYIRNYLGTPSG